MAFRILTLNAISERGLERMPGERFTVGAQVAEPDAILVRSADLLSADIPASVLAIARAGAGTNNIPVARLSARGIPVFNAPGANANAVKELVLAGLLLAARNVCPAWAYVRGLKGDETALEAAVEADKTRFAGWELPGRTLGVLGLGAVGVLVANAALALGMKVLGFDPQLTVQRAWQLHSGVEPARSVEDLLARSDVVTLHVPLTDQTRGLIGGERLSLMRPGAVLLNFARGQVVNEGELGQALDAGHISAYVCDFPSAALKDHPKVVALPHLGASTGEAVDNSAVMVVETLIDFLENGNVRHAVNFPEAALAREPGTTRMVIANANVPNMVGQISTALAAAELNIADLLNQSRGELAYTIIDTDGAIPDSVLSRIRAIRGVLSARVL
jgi:D-3-phosphoglycerate dehydrogenase / 2-oxoglutarate reductase